eukprot:512389_1
MESYDEWSDVEFHFLDGPVWDDMTAMDDTNRVYSILKGASFRVARLHAACIHLWHHKNHCPYLWLPIFISERYSNVHRMITSLLLVSPVVDKSHYIIYFYLVYIITNQCMQSIKSNEVKAAQGSCHSDAKTLLDDAVKQLRE